MKAAKELSSPALSPVIPLALDLLEHNDWNPNEMSDDQFDELKAELKHLDDVPKPVIVRPKGDRYEIIDGAHTFMAAKELGWTEVRCQVCEVDDYEAIRQTLKRNQHGSHNPLLEGLMFSRMMEERGLSKRKLAQDINISEASVRNALKYPEALELRISYAGDEERAAEEIQELTTREVSKYVKLPPGMRDKWLDSGADLSDVSLVDSEVGKAIDHWGLADYLDDTGDGFFHSLVDVKGICQWGLGHQEITDIEHYLKPVAEHGLSRHCLRHLPYEIRNGKYDVLLTPEQWTTALGKAALAKSKASGDSESQVKKEVNRLLQAQGIDPESLTRIDIEKVWQQIQDDEEFAFLVEAEHMTDKERAVMYAARLPVGRESRITAIEATCDYFRHRRNPDRDPTEYPDVGDSVPGVLRRFAGICRFFDHCTAEREMFQDHDALVDHLVNLLESKLEDCLIGDRPAIDFVGERLRTVELPELCLLACSVKGLASYGAHKWLAAMGNKLGVVVTEPTPDEFVESLNLDYEDDEPE